MNASHLAIGAAAVLAAAAHLRARAAGRMGSRSVANVGTISDADLERQLREGVSHHDIVLAWPMDGSGWTFTLQDLKGREHWVYEVDFVSDSRLLFEHVRSLVHETRAFLDALRLPLQLYRGLVIEGGLKDVRPNIGRHWSVDPAVARQFALGGDDVFRFRDKPYQPFVVSMVLDDPAYIDWEASVMNFFLYTAGRGDSFVEQQVTLRPHKDTKEVGRNIQIEPLSPR